MDNFIIDHSWIDSIDWSLEHKEEYEYNRCIVLAIILYIKGNGLNIERASKLFNIDAELLKNIVSGSTIIERNAGLNNEQIISLSKTLELPLKIDFE